MSYHYPPTTKLIPCNIQKDIVYKWHEFVEGGNGCLYGIPFTASRVLQFHVEDKSIKEIGPDLGNVGMKYRNGIRANNGIIYCLHIKAEYILKITPMEGDDAKVELLYDKKVPEGDHYKWRAGALAKDGCIYYLPFRAYHVLKLDPSKGDSLSLVGERLDLKYKMYEAAVLGNDGCIYGISSKQIIKFDPKNSTVSKVGNPLSERHWLYGGVSADDSNIYAANQYGQVLIIDTIKSKYELLGDKMYKENGIGWGTPVLGGDKCIYFPPFNHDRVLKFNPCTRIRSLIGERYRGSKYKWLGGTLASNGYIYCVLINGHHILEMDARLLNEQIIEVVRSVV